MQCELDSGRPVFRCSTLGSRLSFLSSSSRGWQVNAHWWWRGWPSPVGASPVAGCPGLPLPQCGGHVPGAITKFRKWNSPHWKTWVQKLVWNHFSCMLLVKLSKSLNLRRKNICLLLNGRNVKAFCSPAFDLQLCALWPHGNILTLFKGPRTPYPLTGCVSGGIKAQSVIR